MLQRDKRERFENLAEKRINEVIKRLRILGNLSNKTNYDYEDDHIRQMFQVIDSEIKDLKDRFKNSTSSVSSEFKFK